MSNWDQNPSFCSLIISDKKHVFPFNGFNLKSGTIVSPALYIKAHHFLQFIFNWKLLTHVDSLLPTEIPAAPENSPENWVQETLFANGKAAENPVLHPRALHLYALVLARPRYPRLARWLKVDCFFQWCHTYMQPSKFNLSSKLQNQRAGDMLHGLLYVYIYIYFNASAGRRPRRSLEMEVKLVMRANHSGWWLMEQIKGNILWFKSLCVGQLIFVLFNDSTELKKNKERKGFGTNPFIQV